MKLPRRNFLHLAAGAAALPAVTRIASAQAYPTRPVRLMVGFPAGSTSDIYARLVGQWLSERLAQPFVVENMPGAGGNIGTAAVVSAPPDGYTLLMIASANAINATLYERLNFDFLRDIAPIAGPIANPYVMVVNPSFPAKTVLEFVAYAKANPGKINIGSAGVGSTLHLSGDAKVALVSGELGIAFALLLLDPCGLETHQISPCRFIENQHGLWPLRRVAIARSMCEGACS